LNAADRRSHPTIELYAIASRLRESFQPRTAFPVAAPVRPLTQPCIHISFLVHSLRGIFRLPQHPQPAPWPERAENRFALALPSRAPRAERVEMAGALNEARGASASQVGQVVGRS
jgi:hypothetical protein